MKFIIINTEAAYRRMLDETDTDKREAIFRRELVEPFIGLVQTFGGNDGMAQFAQWGMTPKRFEGSGRDTMAAIIEGLAKGDAWNRAAGSLEKGFDAFAAYADRIPTKSITFGLYISDMSAMPQAHGYSGFGAIPGWIMTNYDIPDEYNLARVEAATVHELHHNLATAADAVAFKNIMNVSVGQYMIGEGLAESFAAELYGADKIGPWVTEFDDSTLEKTKAIFRDGMNSKGFNLVRSYIFGGSIAAQMGLPAVDVPLYAGYALGYRVVQAYMQRTGKNVVDTTFVPAEEIIRESRFFD